jgi:hypothetical protein
MYHLSVTIWGHWWVSDNVHTDEQGVEWGRPQLWDSCWWPLGLLEKGGHWWQYSQDGTSRRFHLSCSWGSQKTSTETATFEEEPNLDSESKWKEWVSPCRCLQKGQVPHQRRSTKWWGAGWAKDHTADHSWENRGKITHHTMVQFPSWGFGISFLFSPSGIRVWTQGFALAKQVLYCLKHTSSVLCFSYFGDGLLWTVCSGWPQAVILLISASHIARITGMSHCGPGVS